MKLCILIPSLTIDDFAKLENSIRSTWLTQNDSHSAVYFYYGTGTGEKTFCIGDQIFCGSSEGLLNLGHKTIDAFQWVLENSGFSHLFRTNLSSYVDIDGLCEFIKQLPSERVYTGKLYTDYAFPFISGAGIILSRDVVELIVREKYHWDHSQIDDVALALLLRENGIPIHKKKLRRVDISKPTDIQKVSLHYRVKYETDRNIDTIRMRDIHNSIISRKT